MPMLPLYERAESSFRAARRAAAQAYFYAAKAAACYIIVENLPVQNFLHNGQIRRRRTEKNEGIITTEKSTLSGIYPAAPQTQSNQPTNHKN